MIDIRKIQPHKVSRSLRGYAVFMYGGWKTGKTTTACKFEKALLLAAEKGYNAIPGAMAQPINSWAEFKTVLRQLKEDDVKELYYNIILDTVDILYDYCVKYICSNAPRPGGGVGVDNISDIPFGKGYAMVEKEFDSCLRQIFQMGYGLVMISHDTDKTFKNEGGVEFNKIVPTLDKRANNVVARMADVIMYTRSIPDENGGEKVVAFCRGTSRYEAGSRFEFFPDHFDLSYDNLVNAIGEAVDAVEKKYGGVAVTEERQNAYVDTTSELDFDSLMEEFNNLIANIPGSSDIEQTTEEGKKFFEWYMPRITEIIERYLGTGKKMKDATRTQVDAVSLVIGDLKELIANAK